MKLKGILPLIKSISEADKFSQNLYNWCCRYATSDIFVAFSQENNLIYSPDKTLASKTYIGFNNIDHGYLHGSRLSEILCNGANAKVWAYPPAMNFQVIEDWFDHYIAKGKCHIDPEHTLYQNHERWEISHAVRTCVWCGHEQYKYITMVPMEFWKNVA